MMPWRILLSVLGGIVALGAATPCLWDKDTLEQERARFPSALELITGKFPRHSRAYYEWRVRDRRGRMEAGEDEPQIFDDLAVAFSKLGDDARAIELMVEKELRHPGRYETAANLGTFHLHSGHLEQGIAHIGLALEIDPGAHFGREIYQELLARYLLLRRGKSDSVPLPLQPAPPPLFVEPTEGFWAFVRRERGVQAANKVAEIDAAVKGVLGMLRFGDHESPALLEALSEASYQVEDEAARTAYRAKAEAALATQTPKPNQFENLELAEVERVFETELADAAQWWRELEAKERYWIESGDNVDERYAEAFYAKVPRVNDAGAGRYRMLSRYGGLASAVTIAIAACYLVALARRAKPE
jgi:hypothetical protein